MPMTLGERQEEFSALHPLLIARANYIAHLLGLTVRLGDLFRDPRVHGEIGIKRGYGHPYSCHKLKLAQDILFFENGELTKKGHADLHDWWDRQGGAARIPHDMNHYSIEWNGYR